MTQSQPEENDNNSDSMLGIQLTGQSNDNDSKVPKNFDDNFKNNINDHSFAQTKPELAVNLDNSYSLEENFSKIVAENEELKKQLKEQSLKFHELEIQNKRDNIYISEQKEAFEKNIKNLNYQLQEKSKAFEKQRDNIKILGEKNEQNNLEISEQKKVFEEQLKNLNKKLQATNETLEEKNNEIKDLEQKNIELKDEASKYQSALGTATSLRLSDNDENNSVTLKNDILSLQDSLEDYITKCKGNVEINIEGVQNLLIKYGSQTVITKENKPLIKAVLQRHVVETIMLYAQAYFDNQNIYQGKLYGIETTLFAKANEMINLTKDFANQRIGTDDTTKILPIKLRQQIFGALGNRGFNNIITSGKKTIIHRLILHIQTALNDEIGKYRIIKDPKKKQEIEEMASGIIQKLISLFWFRLEVQEPFAEYIWSEPDTKIDPSYMEGKWDDDEIENLVVDICYFPTISQEFDNKSKRHIYTPGRIFPKSKRSSYIKNLLYI
ncbi:2692_t:CDS:1 [Funneliformis caledonium]|uniref:2692_t:CDS:1 n=1 Tax=Funneliformis caledonium TaxID=1117310 RepID=A0A9N9GGF8_9GLOM|nr:2692_t:CDS:1 [Funneliformis caledonium]